VDPSVSRYPQPQDARRRARARPCSWRPHHPPRPPAISNRSRGTGNRREATARVTGTTGTTQRDANPNRQPATRRSRLRVPGVPPLGYLSVVDFQRGHEAIGARICSRSVLWSSRSTNQITIRPPRIPSAMRPWTPQHNALQRYKVTHDGTEKKRPASARIRFAASGAFSQRWQVMGSNRRRLSIGFTDLRPRGRGICC
jgi:hypothetical protein